MASHSPSIVRLSAALYLLLVLALIIPAWAPLTRPGLPATQAGPLPVLGLYAAERGETPAIAQTPDRWRSDGSWPTWMARFARILGADGAASIKFSLWLALILLAIGAYLWGVRMATHRGGVLAALLVIYTPALLSAIYQRGEAAALWVLASVALAGWGVLREGGPGLLLAAAGALMATASLPGMGLLAIVGLALLALGTRRWTGAGALAVGGMAGLLLAAPWLRPVSALASPAGTAPQLYQLIEPGWLWGVQTLAKSEAASFSLGFALIGLLLVAMWSFPRPPASTDADMTPGRRAHATKTKRTWLLALAVGLLFALLSLFPGLPILSPLVFSRHLLLLSLPFLAVAAASAVYHLSELRETTPIWASLLILPLLGAGPALSPAFLDHPIPERASAIFGQNQIMLLDVRTEGVFAPGQTITVYADWVALQPPDFDYNIFLHLDDASGATLAQVDVQPQDGARPMTGWQPGEIMSDAYSLTIPTSAPADPSTLRASLRLRLGLYDWQTLERLPVGDADALDLAP